MLEPERPTARELAIGFATLACIVAGAAGVLLFILSQQVGGELDLGRAALVSLGGGAAVALIRYLPHIAPALGRLVLTLTAAADGMPFVRPEPEPRAQSDREPHSETPAPSPANPTRLFRIITSRRAA
jgi:hypothetical protein